MRNFSPHLSIASAFLIALTLLFSASGPVLAGNNIQMGVDAAARLQALESDAGNEEPGFEEPRANLHINGDVADNVDFYTELLLNASNSEGNVDLKQAYISSKLGLAELRAGAFEVNFGNQRLTRSDNGQVMNNPLVGNHLVDPLEVQAGVEASSRFGPVNGSVSLTNGHDVAADATNQDRGLAITAKAWGQLHRTLNGAISYYQVDQSDVTGTANNSGLFGAQTPVYDGFASVARPSMGSGEEVSAWQADLEYQPVSRLGLAAYYGALEDDAANEEWDYYNAQATYQFTPVLHGAARYGVAEEDGVNNEYTKQQVGLGYDFNENTVGKFEWVSQEQDNGSAEFDGFVTEVGVSF